MGKTILIAPGGAEIHPGHRLRLGRAFFAEPNGKLSSFHIAVGLSPSGDIFLMEPGSTNGSRVNGVMLSQETTKRKGLQQTHVPALMLVLNLAPPKEHYVAEIQWVTHPATTFVRFGPEDEERGFEFLSRPPSESQVANGIEHVWEIRLLGPQESEGAT